MRCPGLDGSVAEVALADQENPVSVSQAAGTFKLAHDHADRIYLWDYERSRTQRWGQAGLLEFEHADDTASDYDSYDEVAKDRSMTRCRP
jgi:hypothetical protein